MKSRAVMPSKTMKAAFMSEGVEVFGHPPARGGVGQWPLRCGQVVPHVLRPRGARDGTGHRGVTDDPLEEVLCPALDAELAGPRRELFSLRATEKRAFGEGPVDDHAHILFFRQR